MSGGDARREDDRPDVVARAWWLHGQSFRLIFNAIFDADLPPLPDRNWIFPDQRNIYELIDWTDRVPRE